MRKAYIAPDCEYMTFTVDDLIATSNCNNNYNSTGITGNKFSSENICTVNTPAGVLFGEQNTSCVETYIDGYCYYNSVGTILFGS